jgi:S-methylmethionine-dependent homocysteine/selenocysteine methylase
MDDHQQPDEILILDGGTGHLLKRARRSAGGGDQDDDGGNASTAAAAAASPSPPLPLLRIQGLSYDQQFLAGAVANAEASSVVRAVHRAYVEAGADVLTTNSFAAAPRAVRLLPEEVRARLQRRLLPGEEEDNANDDASALRLSAALACEAARVARSAADDAALTKVPRVAGSLPPLGECCYARPGAAPPPPRAQAAAQYLALARALHSGGCDLLLAETLPTSEEALAVLDAAVELGREVWLSFTLRDGPAPPKLRGGELLQSALDRVLDHPASASLVSALLVNCCAPAAATPALPLLVAAAEQIRQRQQQQAHRRARVGCYCNAFRGTTSEWLAKEVGDDEGLAEATAWADARHRGGGVAEFEEEEERAAGEDLLPAEATITPEAYERYAREWVRLGATAVGGCCGIGPRHVRRLVEGLCRQRASG